MTTHDTPDYTYVYLNPDGSYSSAFKADWDAIIFRQFPNGDLAPDSFWDL